ncbi:MAG TPA: hypothetical protein VLA21_04130 [Candidatus Limnocylindria bacterium]|nr:hypothetical protein [Candidatus Limnocylindria bacterium]
MTEIWLVSERVNVARNAFFVERWREAARERGVGLRLVTREELQYGVRGSRAWLRHAEGAPLPQAAVMRLPDPLLAAQLELLGVPCFNNSAVSRVLNDKRLTHQAMCGVAPMMDSVFLRGDEEEPPFPFPVVVKGVSGCGGRQVRLANDAAQVRAALEALRPDAALAQPLSDTPGRDVRAYVLGRDILRTMMRVSHGDFRSNIGQGGEGVPFELGTRERRLVLDIAGMFDFGLVGVDFIFHRGELLLNEIEDAVGTRMLYAAGYDPVPGYLGFILARLA